MSRRTNIAAEEGLSIAQQAAEWWVELRSEECGEGARRDFAAWVGRSPERMAAYLRLAATHAAVTDKALQWPQVPAAQLVREARGSGGSTPMPFLSAGAQKQGARASRKPAWIFAAAAASLLLVFVAGGFWIQPAHYQTALGEQRSVVLPDGSVVTLNTLSRLEVDYDATARSLRLLQGEALFKVAADKVRPFEVTVGEARVRALGTVFNISRRNDGTVVTVVEGRVAVRSFAPVLLPGDQLTLAPRAAPRPSRANVASVTSWTQRLLIFDKRPLGEVVAEFNRYNPQPIVLEDAALGDQQITGVFQANDPDSFADFLEQLPGVSVQTTPGGARRVTATSYRPAAGGQTP